MSGYKTWADLEVLEAADVNEFLMDQAVPRFADTSARDAAIGTPETGQLCWVTGLNLLYWNGTAWTEFTGPQGEQGEQGPPGDVISVNTRTGAVVLTKADVGLSNVDDTSDADKPVSTAQAAADALKVAKAGDTMSGALQINRAAAGDGALLAAVNGDANPRLSVRADGVLTWGTGAAIGDVNLYRSAADYLRTDDNFQIAGAVVSLANSASGIYADSIAAGSLTGLLIGNRVAGDAQRRFYIRHDGQHLWGPGGAITPDTNLYRNGADQLKTDDTFLVGLGLYVLHGGATSLYLNGDYIQAIGTNANQHVYLRAKGTGSAVVNGYAGDGTGGLVVYSGGASPTVLAAIGAGAGLVIRNGSEAGYRLNIGYGGTLNWGDGAGTYDVTLSRASADRLTTDDRFWINANQGAPGLNVTNPHASGDGIDVYAHVGRYMFLGAASGETSGRRFRIETTGKHEWGDGTNAPDTNAYRHAAGVLRTDGAMRVGAYATGSRPSASTVGAGGMVYDTTLSKPIWSDGTVWRDAAGTAV